MKRIVIGYDRPTQTYICKGCGEEFRKRGGGKKKLCPPCRSAKWQAEKERLLLERMATITGAPT